MCARRTRPFLSLVCAVALGSLALQGCAPAADGPSGAADLILTGGQVWTGDEATPWAEAVAVHSDRISAVGSAAEIGALAGPETHVVELNGRFAGPGFIDNHTHFNRAGELLLGVNLLQASDAEGVAAEVKAAAERLPDGAWMVGGLWGAYEAWGQGSTGRGEEAETQAEEAEAAPFSPDRTLIDSISPNNPALLWNWDQSLYLVNGAAISAAGATCAWEGVECGSEGEPTGRITPAASRLFRRAIPPKTVEQKIAEAHAAMADLAQYGVTTIHDITGADQMEVYQLLRGRGELTVRIFARPTLDNWEHLDAIGIKPGFGDEWLKIGGLKGFVDGIMGNSSARFYQPYLTSGELGSWRTMMNPPGNMERLIRGADRAGWDPMVHAIGDHAIDTLLTIFETVIAENPDRERRFRLIHTQVLSGPEAAEKMARLGIIAEVQPYHTIDDMRWMELRIGERSRWAYAFKTLHDAGVMLSFGSDWPGTNAAWYTTNPLHGMYAAVARQTLDGEPPEGWFPEERIDAETALRAYTVNNAWAAREEDLKGTVSVGKLADLVVLDRNPLEVDPSELKDVLVDYTIVGGRIVHEREGM